MDASKLPQLVGPPAELDVSAHLHLAAASAAAAGRWEKQYRIVCPPPTPKKTPSEAKDAKKAKKQGVTTLDTGPTADQMEVMYHEYDLMFHYLDVFAGIGQHR